MSGPHAPARRPSRGAGRHGVRLGSALLGGALLVELLIALLGSGLKAIGEYGAPYAPGPRTYGTPAYIGNLLLTRFLLAFETASFLLLIAAVGAVVLARRRGGLGEERELLAPLELERPRGTGTMAEGVTGLAFARVHDRAADNGEGEGEGAEHPEPAIVGGGGEPPAATAGSASRGETAGTGHDRAGGW
jgi:NADH-quinone oxidoreductase subunit J